MTCLLSLLPVLVLLRSPAVLSLAPEADLPAFASSALVQSERFAWNSTCIAGCGGLSAAIDQIRDHYTRLDRVFVLDWNSHGLNGLGNSLPHFTGVLTACFLSGRACLSQRSSSHCTGAGSSCTPLFDPGAYFSAWPGFDWRWNDAAAAQLRRQNTSHLDLHFSTVRAGFQDHTGTVHINDALDVLSLLQHPLVRDVPWVTLHLPAPANTSAVDALWKAADRRRGWWDASIVSGLNRAVGAALNGSLACHVDAAKQCIARFFQHPLPLLQAAVLPHLVRVDAIHAAGGVAVGVHVRSGYADYAARMVEVIRSDGKPGSELRGRDPRVDAAPFWRTLDAAFVPCPAAGTANVTQACTSFGDAAALAMNTGGASCGGPAATSSVRAHFMEMEAGNSRGPMSSLMACAVASAQAHDPNIWLLYIAGDLPPLVQLANVSTSLASHVVTASGDVGHVSSAVVCHGAGERQTCSESRADPGGAWTKALVDFFMLSVCDRVIHVGTSSFVTAALARRPSPLRDDEVLWWPVHVVPKDEALHVHETLVAAIGALHDALESTLHDGDSDTNRTTQASATPPPVSFLMPPPPSPAVMNNRAPPWLVRMGFVQRRGARDIA